nr:cbb3-type cytochrome c oxidase subunit 3 [Pelagibacterium sediminicola]
MMPDHETLVGLAKSFGLFYLIAMAIAVLIYVFWPGNKKKFDRAKQAPLDDGEDRP